MALMHERLLADQPPVDEPTYQALPQALKERSATLVREFLGTGSRGRDRAVALRAYFCKLMPAFVAAGGTLLAGTDSFCVRTYPGDLHLELELLVQCGVSPAQALAAATVNPARWLRKEDLGVVKAGAQADLLVLRGNPLANIRATREIEWVIKDGRPLRPAEILKTAR